MDGSMGFDFYGVYDNIITNELIEFKLGDGRKVKVKFVKENNAVKVTIIFEAESENSIELQKTGWQAILDNIKKYTETE